MSRATNQHTTKLSDLFQDPFVAQTFRRAEDDGTAPELADRTTRHASRAAQLSA